MRRRVAIAGPIKAELRDRLTTGCADGALQGGAHYQLQLEQAGRCVLFCEHAPEEFGLHLKGAELLEERRYGSQHHDAEIGSIGLEDPRPLDPNKLNDWLSYLLQSRGQD